MRGTMIRSAPKGRPSEATVISALSVVFLLAVLPRVVTGSPLPLVVIKLDDSNFEHATQASTGQTTGIWFVLLASATNDEHQAARKLWDDLSTVEDRSVVYTVVDTDVNNATASRFHELRGEETPADAPFTFLLRNRKLYVYTGPLEGEEAPASITKFAMEDYQSLAGHEVPPPRLAATDGGKSGIDYITIFGTIFSFVMFEVGRHYIDRDRLRRLERQRAAVAAEAAGEGEPAEGTAAASGGVEEKKQK